MRCTFDHYIERGDEELHLVVTYKGTDIVPATYWQPEEGGEIEIVSVEHNGIEFDLTDDEEEELVEICNDRLLSDFADEADSYADWKYEEYRDRMMDYD